MLEFEKAAMDLIRPLEKEPIEEREGPKDVDFMVSVNKKLQVTVHRCSQNVDIVGAPAGANPNINSVPNSKSVGGQKSQLLNRHADLLKSLPDLEITLADIRYVSIWVSNKTRNPKFASDLTRIALIHQDPKVSTLCIGVRNDDSLFMRYNNRFIGEAIFHDLLARHMGYPKHDQCNAMTTISYLIGHELLHYRFGHFNPKVSRALIDSSVGIRPTPASDKLTQKILDGISASIQNNIQEAMNNTLMTNLLGVGAADSGVEPGSKRHGIADALLWEGYSRDYEYEYDTAFPIYLRTGSTFELKKSDYREYPLSSDLTWNDIVAFASFLVLSSTEVDRTELLPPKLPQPSQPPGGGEEGGGGGGTPEDDGEEGENSSGGGTPGQGGAEDDPGSTENGSGSGGTTTEKPEFQIGDEVKVKTTGEVGVISAVNDDGTYTVSKIPGIPESATIIGVFGPDDIQAHRATEPEGGEGEPEGDSGNPGDEEGELKEPGDQEGEGGTPDGPGDGKEDPTEAPGGSQDPGSEDPDALPQNIKDLLDGLEDQGGNTLGSNLKDGTAELEPELPADKSPEEESDDSEMILDQMSGDLGTSKEVGERSREDGGQSSGSGIGKSGDSDASFSLFDSPKLVHTELIRQVDRWVKMLKGKAKINIIRDPARPSKKIQGVWGHETEEPPKRSGKGGKKILVMLFDTSGSINKTLLSMVMNDVAIRLKQSRLIEEVIIIDFDGSHPIRSVKPKQARPIIKSMTKGWTGSNFIPGAMALIRFMESQPKSKRDRIAGLAIFSDFLVSPMNLPKEITQQKMPVLAVGLKASEHWMNKFIRGNPTLAVSSIIYNGTTVKDIKLARRPERRG